MEVIKLAVENLSPGWTYLPQGVLCSPGPGFGPRAAFANLLDSKSGSQGLVLGPRLSSAVLSSFLLAVPVYWAQHVALSTTYIR